MARSSTAWPSGYPAETLFEEIPSGLAGVFLLLAIPILAGSVMAKYIVEQGMVQDMLSDIRKLVKKPVILSSASGYVLAPPTTCPVTTFMMLAPVVEHIAGEGKRRSILVYALAIGSTLGAAFIYPTPQNYPLFDIIHTDLSPVSFDLVAIPFSLCILAAVIDSSVKGPGKKNRTMVKSASLPARNGSTGGPGHHLSPFSLQSR